jgi:hypothetical protein
MDPTAQVRALIDEYNLATEWEIRFVDRPHDPAAALRELRDAGMDVATNEAVALAARNRELVDWLATDAQALRSFGADPRAAVAARDAGRRPRARHGAGEGTFSATPASRRVALADARRELGAWALSSSENLRMLVRDPVRSAHIFAHGRDLTEVRALAVSLRRKPKTRGAKSPRRRAAGDR